MPHAEREHELMIEIARLTKERDELKLQVESKHNALIALREQCDEAREACAAEKARADAAVSELDLAKSTLETVDAHRTELGEALAAARRECEATRHTADRALESIQIRCREGDKRSDWLPVIDGIATGARAALSATAALAGPAPAPGKETRTGSEQTMCPHGRGSNESCQFCSVTGEFE